MALTIELVQNGKVVRGIEDWWDPVDTAMAERRSDFPTLSRVDPYGDLVLHGDDLARLIDDIDALRASASSPAVTLLRHLRGLATDAARSDAAELRFRGD